MLWLSKDRTTGIEELTIIVMRKATTNYIENNEGNSGKHKIESQVVNS
jgi:hypothetical protein